MYGSENLKLSGIYLEKNGLWCNGQGCWVQIWQPWFKSQCWPYLTLIFGFLFVIMNINFGRKLKKEVSLYTKFLLEILSKLNIFVPYHKIVNWKIKISRTVTREKSKPSILHVFPQSRELCKVRQNCAFILWESFLKT